MPDTESEIKKEECESEEITEKESFDEMDAEHGDGGLDCKI